MYCPNCASDLPSVAKFCVKCGFRVDMYAGQATSPPQRLFCKDCGYPNESSGRFCSRCGRALLDNVTGTFPQVESSAAENPISERSGASDFSPDRQAAFEGHSVAAFVSAASEPHLPASFFKYLLVVIGCMFSVASVALLVADAMAREHWENPLVLAGAGVVAITFFTGFVSFDKRLRAEGELDGVVRFRRRRILVNAIIFAVIFFTSSSAIGYEIGVSGSETSQLIADLGMMRTVGDRISASRDSAARTIPAQIQMYESIDSDVQQFASVTDRLQSEIQTYDLKYPAQHVTTEDLIRSIKIASERAVLLQRQVNLARQLQSLSDDAQWSIWKEQMQPLLDQENSLSQ